MVTLGFHKFLNWREYPGGHLERPRARPSPAHRPPPPPTPPPACFPRSRPNRSLHPRAPHPRRPGFVEQSARLCKFILIHIGMQTERKIRNSNKSRRSPIFLSFLIFISFFSLIIVCSFGVKTTTHFFCFLSLSLALSSFFFPLKNPNLLMPFPPAIRGVVCVW